MKKLLALVLALVMTLGLATVSSSAAYSDAADVSLDEAVDVMSAVGVFQGADGKFSPKANLNREQAAKLIAYLDLGENAAEALPAVKVFSDVPTTSWSAKYIAYCADAGYIAGDGTGKFNPTGELTGYAFGKMVLCVLGYDADIEGFTGNNWSISVAKLMESNDIADGIDSAASATLTREQAAQYCLNALKATMVDYESKGTKVTINGAEIATGASKAKAVTTANDTGAIADVKGGAGTLQLGEKLYKGNLVKGNGDDDAFGRPSDHKWTYKTGSTTKTIYNAVDAPAFTYTKKTSDANLLKDLKNYKFTDGNSTVVTIADKDTKAKNVDAKSAIDVGDLAVAKNADILDALSTLTDEGKTVEVYTDDDKNVTDVVAIAYYVAKVDSVSTNSKTNITTYTLKTPAADTVTLKDDEDAAATSKIALEDGATAAKGEWVTYAKGSDAVHVYPTTVVTGSQSAFKNSTTSATVTVDGTTYPVGLGVWKNSAGNSAVAIGDFTNSSTKYDYVLDQFGFVVARVAVEAEETGDYAYVVASDLGDESTSFGSSSRALKARVALSDGTFATYTIETEKVASGDVSTVNARTIGGDTVAANDYVVKGTKIIVYDADDGSDKAKNDDNLDGKVFGYTLKDDVMTITSAPAAAASTLTKGTVYTDALTTAKTDANKVGTYTLLNGDTSYVIINASKKTAKLMSAADVKSTYETVTGTAVIEATGTALGSAKIVFATATGAAASTNKYAFLKSATPVEQGSGSDVKYVYTAYDEDGAEIELTATSTSSVAAGLYAINAEKTISGAPTTSEPATAKLTGITVQDGKLVASTNVYTYDDAKIVDLTTDQTGIVAGGFNAYLVLNKTSSSDAAKVIFIVD